MNDATKQEIFDETKKELDYYQEWLNTVHILRKVHYALNYIKKNTYLDRDYSLDQLMLEIEDII